MDWQQLAVSWAILGLAGLTIFGPYFYFQRRKRRKELQRFKSLSSEQRQLEMMKVQAKLQKYKTSHFLHLVLVFFTCGLWLFAWIAISLSNSSQVRQIEDTMKNISESASS